VRDSGRSCSRAVAGRWGRAVGILGTATLLVAAIPPDSLARDSHYYGPYVPRGYYTPGFDGRSRFDDGYADPLIRQTAEQLRRSPKPPPTKGPLLVTVSLASQRLTLYDDGVAIAHSPISSGTAEYPTPTGVFSVIQKARWHRSNLYSAAPMPFMQRLTWSGVAVHAGKLPGYPASHGCIRLPDEFAVRLWRTTSNGARVVISQKDLAPVEISHPRLFTLPPPDAPPVAQRRPVIQPASAVAGAAAAPLSDAPNAAPASDVAPASVGPAETSSTGETKVASAEGVPAPGTDQPAAEKPLRPGPVSVFVSRKEQRLYVRKGFEPLFDMPVVIRNPEQPLGTHLMVAMTPKEASSTARWMVVSPPPQESGIVHRDRSPKRKSAKVAPPPPPAAQSPVAASAALDRIEMPAEAVQRISELMSVGAALTISDEGLGPETGKETDFVVVTSPIQPTKRVRPSYDRYDFYRPSRRWY
jgi:hypothetical protein